MKKNKQNENISKRFEFDLAIGNFKPVKFKDHFDHEIIAYYFSLDYKLSKKEKYKMLKILLDLDYEDTINSLIRSEFRYSVNPNPNSLVIFPNKKRFNFSSIIANREYSIIERYYGGITPSPSGYPSVGRSILRIVSKNVLPEYIKDYKVSIIDKIKLKRRLKNCYY